MRFLITCFWLLVIAALLLIGWQIFLAASGQIDITRAVLASMTLAFGGWFSACMADCLEAS